MTPCAAKMNEGKATEATEPSKAHLGASAKTLDHLTTYCPCLFEGHRAMDAVCEGWQPKVAGMEVEQRSKHGALGAVSIPLLANKGGNDHNRHACCLRRLQAPPTVQHPGRSQDTVASAQGRE